MPDQDYDKDELVALLNRIVEEELAGVVRYTHYSRMLRRPGDIETFGQQQKNG